MNIRTCRRDFQSRKNRLEERDRTDIGTLRECVTWVFLMLADVRAELVKNTQEWRDTYELWYGPPAPLEPRVFYYQNLGATVMRGASWLFVVLEVAFSAALTIVLMALPWWVAVIVGILLAWLLASGAKGLVTSLLVKYTPRAALYRIFVLLVLLGCLWIGFLSVGLRRCPVPLPGLLGERLAYWPRCRPYSYHREPRHHRRPSPHLGVARYLLRRRRVVRCTHHDDQATSSQGFLLS